MRLEIDGVVHEVPVELTGHGVTVGHHGESYLFLIPDKVSPASAVAVSGGAVNAPMPGTVVAVNVHKGQQVTAGMVLGVLEAMKMEMALTAPHDGTVEEVNASVGDQVALGATLFTVEAS
jgi:acetyl/propionyl-CoA carboxylase alpha subunit